MKTIEEEYKLLVSQFGEKTPEISFENGVKFAQRWIPIEEGKPTRQGHYLVICPKSYPKNCTVVVAEFYEDNDTFYSESSDEPLEDVTHWRQIEVL